MRFFARTRKHIATLSDTQQRVQPVGVDSGEGWRWLYSFATDGEREEAGDADINARHRRRTNWLELARAGVPISVDHSVPMEGKLENQ